MKQYETVIGLEVHVELATKTKIFCGCSTEFGGAPNTHTCPVCTGMPGSLPVLNKKVVEFALKAGLAANCQIHQYCKFDRKNYFYPDNPQNYQISQLYLPICHDGWVEIETSAGKKKIRIHEMHMEEDAGKLIHDEWEDCSLVDYNRSGVPLIEIVSEPDMRSSEEVIAYLEKLRCMMQYLGVSDCKLQEGSMRADVNLSVREVGAEEFGTRTEMKNLNSFKAIARAIEGERERQIELIEEGKATISTAICTRDDIMIYLINQGVESALAFTIMESVRKGKGLKPEWEEAMKAQNVPDWYIWSCKKISYMFPKAHAAAYVMMAYRIAYCKINYPLAYYAAYFSIRADAFSYEIMCQGREKLDYYMKDYKRRSDTLTKKEQDTMKDMKIVQEMYARGFEFVPVDLYKAKAKMFQIVDGKLMPSFASIEGMGDKAAEAVEEAGKDGPYLSLDDFRQRTKVSKTVIDLMSELGLFGNLPKSNQLSLFDF